MPWKVPTFSLSNGQSVPLVGLGTYLLDSDRLVTEVLDRALTAGYRFFDTAAMYDNETEIGSALKELLPKHSLKREDVFVQTKLYPSDHGSKAKKALENSLRKLQCGYLDSYLIHWPGTFGASSRSSDNSKLRGQSWASLVEAKEEGLVKHLGVSNYTVAHLEELLENDCGVKPVLNQIEWHPACHQDEIKAFCDKHGILVQAYMPLGNAKKNILNNKHVVSVAQKLNKEPAQILLRWSVQQNVAVIPKARSKAHLEANIDLDFEISQEDMRTLSTKVDHHRVDWDPNSVK